MKVGEMRMGILSALGYEIIGLCGVLLVLAWRLLAAEQRQFGRLVKIQEGRTKSSRSTKSAINAQPTRRR
ncbi:MAG: hypothetical protein DMG13_14940 [Acidobacteria bacterium]|nr:MAG: hypothetical protein DMG13_14940 [Acidobacteriota bacterium]